MAGVTRREFLNYGGGASAALAFMAANGIKLNANPLGLPIGSQMWPHRALHRHHGYAGLAAVLKDLKSVGVESVETISPSGEFEGLTDGKQAPKDAGRRWPEELQRALPRRPNGRQSADAHRRGATRSA